MKVYLLLVFLFFIPDTFTKVDPGLRVDVDFPGNDILQILSPDVYHCQLACTQHNSCVFFTFLRPDWDKDNRQFYCYLKNTANGLPTVSQELKGVTSGFPLSLQEYKTPVCLPSIYQNVDFTGSDYYSTFNTLEECQSACTNDPRCQFFSYLTKEYTPAQYRQKCHLKQVMTLPVPTKVVTMQNVISGFSLKNCETAANKESTE